MLAKRLALIATYNERENVAPLVRQILALPPDLCVLVVDDNSPDGTGAVADQLAREEGRVRVLHRPRKEGLSAALRAGFQWALEKGFEVVVNLDGDRSHDPNDIPRLLAAAAEADLVIGSRYLEGVRVVNWPRRRLWLSLLGGQYIRTVTGLPFRDPTSGFRCFRAEVLRLIETVPLRSRGYSFHFETLFWAWKGGCHVCEVPITFSERSSGASKMSVKIILEALVLAARLALANAGRQSGTVSAASSRDVLANNRG